MSVVVTFPYLSMCWNSHDVNPFTFDNTMKVEKDHPVAHLVAWTAVVARSAPGGRLKALVINCHGVYVLDYTGTTDSAGGIPLNSNGYWLKIGDDLDSDNAGLFRALDGLVKEVHLYACGAASSPVRSLFAPPTTNNAKMCQIIADTSRAVVVASTNNQPDVFGPGLNQAPKMVGKVIRFVPRKP